MKNKAKSRFINKIHKERDEKMRRKHVFVLLLSIVLFFGSFVSPFAASAASTISVKLQNYIGNKQSLDISTKGIYKFSNNNTRYSGSNRYEVADRVAAAGWQSASTVIVVNSEAFADALSAAPLAYKYNAPILMTSSTTLPAVMENRIKALRPSNIIIIGGSGSVSTEVEAKLKTLAPNVTRIGGKSRFEVAKLVSENFPTAQKAIVTNGLTFADALAIAPYAAKNGIPILLTTPSSLPESTTQALVGKTSTLIIGGESSVSKNVENQLAAPVRIGGKDRYEVSANIIKELNMNAETAFLSNGASFADALSGSVLAAKLDAPLLLTPSTKLPASVSAVISSKGTSNFHILGGTASVSDTLVNSLPNEYTLEPGVSYSVKAVNNSLVLYQGNTVVKSFDSNNFRLVPANYSSSNQILINNKPYLGTMDFTIENGYVRPINRDIPFEDYLKGVVPREMPASWEIEALKAQAVAARTYSVDDIGKTVVDTQSYQVYGGYQWDDRTNQAVNATKGKVLKFKNSKGNLELVQTFFSSSNGGYTATNKDEWNTTKLPYLDNKADSFDASANPSDPSNGWSVKVDKVQIDLGKLATELNLDPAKILYNPGWWWGSAVEKDSVLATAVKNYLATAGYANKDIKIIGINNFVMGPKNPANRIASATLKVDFYIKDKSTNQYSCENGNCNGTSPLKKYSVDINRTGVQIRSMFGGTRFKSTLLTNVVQSQDSFTIQGKGYGHGIGMSQNGAQNRAKAGHTYEQILQFYYPTSILSTENY